MQEHRTKLVYENALDFDQREAFQDSIESQSAKINTYLICWNSFGDTEVILWVTAPTRSEARGIAYDVFKTALAHALPPL